MTTNNPPEDTDEAREIMRQYYEGLMNNKDTEVKPGQRSVTHPRYNEAEVSSPEYRAVNRQRQQTGLAPISNRQGRRIPTAVSLTEDEAAKLRDLAEEWGYVHGGRGNISAFVAAIALGDFILTPVYANG